MTDDQLNQIKKHISSMEDRMDTKLMFSFMITLIFISLVAMCIIKELQ